MRAIKDIADKANNTDEIIAAISIDEEAIRKVINDRGDNNGFKHENIQSEKIAKQDLGNLLLADTLIAAYKVHGLVSGGDHVNSCDSPSAGTPATKVPDSKSPN